MAWVLCEITEYSAEEFDWSKIPEDRRELVRARHMAARPSVMSRWLLWDSQIEHYRSRSWIGDVTILPNQEDQ